MQGCNRKARSLTRAGAQEPAGGPTLSARGPRASVEMRKESRCKAPTESRTGPPLFHKYVQMSLT